MWHLLIKTRLRILLPIYYFYIVNKVSPHIAQLTTQRHDTDVSGKTLYKQHNPLAYTPYITLQIKCWRRWLFKAEQEGRGVLKYDLGDLLSNIINSVTKL